MSRKGFNILVVDDEKPARKRLLSLLRSAEPEAQIAEASNADQATKLILSTQIALIFLDIQMPSMGGLQLFRQVGHAHMPLTIFVTAYDRYAVEAFETSALDYLLKPYSDERFEAALARAKRRLHEADLSRVGQLVLQRGTNSDAPNRYLERLVVKDRGTICLIPVADVECFSGAGSYVLLHTARRELLYSGTLNQLSKVLDPNAFVRVHRSAIVNVSAIMVLQPTSHGEFEATLRSGRHIQISRTYRPEFERYLQQKL